MGSEHFTALDIVHAESGRTLSKEDFAMCMRMVKRALSTPSAVAAEDARPEAALLNEIEERLAHWRCPIGNEDGDHLGLYDLIGADHMESLIDEVCAPFAPHPAPAVAAEAGQGEREAFEAWARSEGLNLGRDSDPDRGGRYVIWTTVRAWTAWQARAALATRPAPPSQGQIPAEWRKAVQEAYGHLWHVNNEPMAPIPLRSPEAAAYEARKCLRELLTTTERGEAINAVGALLDRSAAPTQPPAEGG